MKFLIIAALLFAAFAIPDKSVTVAVNVAPPRISNARRDTLPDVRMGFGNVADAERLTYALDGESGIIIKYIDFCSILTGTGKIYARLNQMTEDGYIMRTLVASEIQPRKLNVTIPCYGIFKIAIFREGAYCSGIEYDFRFFGVNDMTHIGQFNHRQILCQ
jgi:hypothetical protein